MKNSNVVPRPRPFLSRASRQKLITALERASEDQRFSLERRAEQTVLAEQLRKIQARAEDFSVFSDELNYSQMLALAVTFKEWAEGNGRSPQQSEMLLEFSESFALLAGKLGPAWTPNPPPQLSVFGVLGREFCS
jgi:hypothetical protein